MSYKRVLEISKQLNISQIEYVSDQTKMSFRRQYTRRRKRSLTFKLDGQTDGKELMKND